MFEASTPWDAPTTAAHPALPYAHSPPQGCPGTLSLAIQSSAARSISDLEAAHVIYIANEQEGGRGGGGELQSSARCRFQRLPELFIEQGCHSQGSLQIITSKEEA